MSRISVEDRADPAVADEVIRAVFGKVSGSAMRSYIDFLVGDIRHLVSHYNDRWGITLFGWGLRLNVGWVECLVLHSGGLRVLIDTDSRSGPHEL